MAGWNGKIKQTHLCIGGANSNCYTNAYETLNCANDLKSAEDDFSSLGEGKPGCVQPDECPNGLPWLDRTKKLCEKPVEEYKGSAEVVREIPPLKPSELIEQPFDKPSVTREVVVDE